MTKTTFIDEAITDYFGERCPDFEPGCPGCRAWAERDALQARAERAEAVLRGVYHTALEIESGDASGYEIADTIKANLAQLDAEPACRKCGGAMKPSKAIGQTFTAGLPDFPGDERASTMSAGGPGALIDAMKCSECGWSVTPAEPAGVSEPAGVKVKPGELERIVWSAMVWARENPGPDEVPEYTDGGNSFAETECRATVARILAALEPGQTHREGWGQAKEAAARKAEIGPTGAYKTEAEVNAAIDQGKFIASTIRAMPYPGDSQ